MIVESKRWQRPLDRSSGPERGEVETPSSQMLRYLTRAEAMSDRAVMWGMLTNGRYWRLYWQGARSRSEEYLEFDLADLAGTKGLQGDLLGPAAEPAHALQVFFVTFRAQAFLAQAGDAQGRSFHRIALDESRHWESRVSTALGERVFNDVFPRLVSALVAADPRAEPAELRYREDVKRSALILLYRLLFVLYAEDRDLLPVRDQRYDDYSLRKVRHDIADRIDRNDTFATTMLRYWQHLTGLFRAIAAGEQSIGLPAYNGGLFTDSEGALLSRVALGDAKVQGQTLNLFIVEQLPLIAPPRLAAPLGAGSVADLIRREVLHLSYTAHDLAAFARDLGHEGGPFAWDIEDRRHRMARLDALFFRLYGLDRDDAAYNLSTFPIVQEADERAFGRYRTRDLVLGYMNAQAAGDVDSVLAV